MMKVLLSLIILFLSAILPSFSQDENEINPENVTARVIEVIYEKPNLELEETFHQKQTVQRVRLKVLDGSYKGKTITIDNQLTSSPVYDIKVKEGDRVLLDVEKEKGKTNFYIADRERLPALMIIAGLFFVLLLAIGGFKGLQSLISVVITSSLVFFFMIPSILHNYPIIPVTIIVSLASTLLTMFIVGGINLKSLAASIGTVGGVTTAGLISLFVIKIAPLSGLHDQESIILWTSRPDLNFTGILTASMIIGSLGAIMDVGISIASSIAELKVIDNTLTPVQLMKSGLNVGKDIMGTMANTLILAYIGSALPLILLAANAPLVKLINLNSIASEISSAIIGSIGIVLCVPITAIVSGYLMGKTPKSMLPENTDLLDIKE